MPMMRPLPEFLMDIEIMRSPYLMAMMNELAFDGEKHQVLPYSWPWLEACQRWAPGTRLFVYKHRLSERFVICNWLWSPKEAAIPVAMELEGFTDGDPRSLWPSDLLPPSVMKDRLLPVQVQVQRAARKRKDKKDLEDHQKTDDLKHRTSVANYLRRKGMTQEAHKLNTGQTPFVGPARSPQGNEMWKELLLQMKKKV